MHCFRWGLKASGECLVQVPKRFANVVEIIKIDYTIETNGPKKIERCLITKGLR